MPSLNPIGQLAVSYAMCLFWTTWIVLQMMWSMLTRGPREFFGGPFRKQRPEILNDSSLGEHQYVKLKTGVRLHYVSNGSKDAPLMLFLHGFPEFWYSWRHQIREFSNDYRTVAVDMRGYGESDKPRGTSNYHISFLIEDVKELILALGYKQCILVAHDWGGAVGNAFVLTYPEMVSQFVLCNIPHPRAFREHIQEHKSQVLKSWYMMFFQMPWLPEIWVKSFDFEFAEKIFKLKAKGCSQPPCTDEDVEAYKYTMDQPGSMTAQINYYRAAIRYKQTEPPSWDIKTPTLMVWGTQDMALEKGMAEKSAKYFSEFTLKFVPTSGHWVQMEEPDVVNKHMRDFLTKQ